MTRVPTLTRMLASRKLRPVPTLLSIWLMLVAVTLSSAGNQAADTAGGAAVTTMLGIPFSTEPRWYISVSVESGTPGHTRKMQRTAVPDTLLTFSCVLDCMYQRPTDG